MLHHRLVIACLLLGAASAAAQSKPAAKQTLDAYAKSQLNKVLDAAASADDLKPLRAEATRTLALVAAHGTDRNLDAFRDAAYAARLLEITEQLPAAKRPDFLKTLRANDALGRTLAFNITARDKVPGAAEVITTIAEKYPADLDKYAQLITALALVHDQPFSRHINENLAKSPSPLELYDFYTKNESAMYFGIKAVPAELLIWVVDNTASIDDAKWALAKFAKDDAVGRRFFDIKYDYDHFRNNSKKKITELGFTLQNIAKYGGVCADQAYFAMTVGKSIGVPTAYATANSGTVGHAWVGFLQAQQGKGWWNFDFGRYEEYRGNKGNVPDPQTRQRVPDAFVSLTAEMIGTKPADRQAAAALTDAANLLAQLPSTAADAPKLPEEVIAPRPKPRITQADDQLELLDLALRQNPAHAFAWFSLRELAEKNQLSLDQKKRAAESLLKITGTKYPDFALVILKPMIESVDDVKEQDRLWSNAFNLFQKRADLAAEIRMEQAELWEKQNNIARAGECYMDVINRFANAGPFVITALSKAEKLLRDSKKDDRIVTLYETTWTKLIRPRDMAGPFMTQSNWYRVGTIYASKLAEAGDKQKADAVKAQLEGAVAKK